MNVPRYGLSFCLVLAFSASSCQRDPFAKDRERAIQLVERRLGMVSPSLPYQRACATRLRDGFLFTYVTEAAEAARGMVAFDVPSHVMAVVADDEQPRMLTPHLEPIQEMQERSGGPGQVDSVEAIRRAQRVLPESFMIHCYEKLESGSWVTFVRADASARSGEFIGVVVAITPTDSARVVMRF